jgi:hypothetical protein
VPIEELELGVRAYNIVKRMGVVTCDDLLKVGVHDLHDYYMRTGAAIGYTAAMQIADAQDYINKYVRTH